jgi:hypothetical protein
MIMAVCALVPGLITLVIAIVADRDHPAVAGVWNALEPRGDDALFVGIVLFAGTVALRLGRRMPDLASWLGSWQFPAWLASCWRRPGVGAVPLRRSVRCSS